MCTHINVILKKKINLNKEDGNNKNQGSLLYFMFLTYFIDL